MALWNFTIPGASPILSYHPYADGFGLQNGWQTWYTVSGFNKNPGDSSHGDSYHLTSLPGAQVSLEFFGSAIYLYGNSNASYEVVVDNDVESFSGATGLLYSNAGLIEENHIVTLRAQPTNLTQQVQFGSAIISSSASSSGGQIPTQKFYDNTASALSYSGQWTNSTVQGIPNNTVTAPFHQTVDAGASVSMNISSAAAVALYASTNFGHDLFSVSLDNAAPQIFNASTFWLVTDTVIFFQSGLDFGRTYNLNIINMSGGAKLTLNSVVTYQVTNGSNSTTAQANSGTSSHSGAKIGEIVGPIVGVFVLGLIATFFWLRSRKRRASREAVVSPLVLPEGTAEMGMASPRKGDITLPQPAPAPSVISTTSPTSPTDVNQLLELLAQRIDRRDGNHISESASPPDYRAHTM
ncbi:hypothetical protein B0H19DRAFT_163324 [Mycena capillaripes]|nr:hypothetical protein B0H19DRAFT_163324 [Mycena capillaripes]